MDKKLHLSLGFRFIERVVECPHDTKGVEADSLQTEHNEIGTSGL